MGLQFRLFLFQLGSLQLSVLLGLFFFVELCLLFEGESGLFSERERLWLRNFDLFLLFFVEKILFLFEDLLLLRDIGAIKLLDYLLSIVTHLYLDVLEFKDLRCLVVDLILLLEIVIEELIIITLLLLLLMH